jgi:hypothetical protein
MNPLLALVAAGIAAGLLYRRFRRKPRHGAVPKKLDVTITLGGTAQNPTVDACPLDIVAAPGDHVRWTISDPGSTGAEVWLKGFRLKGTPTHKDLFDGPDASRKGRTEIRDKVKRNAEVNHYDYEVWLNGRLAADPDILIKDI